MFPDKKQRPRHKDGPRTTSPSPAVIYITNGGELAQGPWAFLLWSSNSDNRE